jgi:hypothetical protein
MLGGVAVNQGSSSLEAPKEGLGCLFLIRAFGSTTATRQAYFSLT